jgi:TonB family protein
MIAPRRIALFALLALLFPGCAAPSSTSPAGEAKPKSAVLLRTYFVPLRPDVKMGPAHPPTDGFQTSGYLPGGMSGKDQLWALSQRFTLPSLAYQYSDVQPFEPGKETVLEMGFGEQIQVKVSDEAQAGGGAQIAMFNITFGPKEVLRRKIPWKNGEVLLFSGHLDPSLPILSIFTIEIRHFGAEESAAYTGFLLQARNDAEAFAPPPVKQRDQEPYLPGVGDVTMPEVITRQNAIYPEAARADKLDAQVIIEVVVDKEGKPTNPRVLTPPTIFDASALDSVATYRYKPATKNGKPVSVTMNIITVFKFTMQPNQ